MKVVLAGVRSEIKFRVFDKLSPLRSVLGNNFESSKFHENNCEDITVYLWEKFIFYFGR